jgi:DNA topoisomerase II
MAETYKKHTHREHVLELPDTYIGSIETSEESRWIYDAKDQKMVHRKVQFNPGLYKTFDELIVNARDALVRSQGDASRTPIKRIDISAGSVEGKFTIVVKNDGDGIPIQKHETEKCWIPELIFGHLLTSSNYNKDEEKIVGGKNGYGAKCIRHDTLVPLWDGSIKKASEITTKDILIGDDGTMRQINSIIKGSGKIYEVKQAHAEPYYVNDQHILTLHMPDHKVIFWSATQNEWSVLWWDNNEKCIKRKSNAIERVSIQCPECNATLSSNLDRHYRRVHKDSTIPKCQRKSPTQIHPDTDEVKNAKKELEKFCETIDDNNVFDISIQDYLKLNDTTKKRLAGVRGQCVQWEKKDVLLDPYILGLWLGDGMKCGRKYACYGEKDPELIEAFEDWCNKNDAIIKKTDVYSYQISSKSNFGKKGSSPLRKLLDEYNLINNKHIPLEYLLNDRETRLKILAGIIDTDGHTSRDGTRISITQSITHDQLAKDIILLSRSLGFCTQYKIHNTQWKVKDEVRKGQAYHINISGTNVGDIPTRLPRKKCCPTLTRNTSKSTGFLSISEVGIDEYVGFSINRNERFLINDFTVTHNCTNIFSESFKISLRDPKSQQRYDQVWKNNMSICEKPSIQKDKATKGYVEITYIPELNRFIGFHQEDMITVLHTRTIELAALAGKDVKVTWNGEEIKTDTFEKFVRLFLKADSEKQLAYERCNDRWEVAAVLTHSLFSDETGTPEDRHISFVNGINTRKGGKHVETVQRHVLSDICEVATKKKKMDLKPGQIKDTITLFVNATIVNPAFDSQTKETLTTPATKFGSSVSISPKFVDSLVKAGVLEEAQAILNAKMAKDTKKTDGAKKRTIYGLPKLEDALLAGTAKSSECTIILTEGDSAATSAIAGLKVVGRERWGVFPLRGKLLNVKDISRDKFNNNEELTAIKKIIGLEQGKVYKDTSSLRYGRILIMSDQDVDGFHIRGLLMNLFHTEWPDLMHMGFLCSLMTPLVKMTRGNEVLSFYSDAELETWRDSVGADVYNRYKSKYYKGLGTSTPAEAREWFENLSDIRYEWDDATDTNMNLAFSKKMSDDRKTWLSTYDPKRSVKPVIESTGKRKVPYSRFVHDELIHFSNADNLRSLPHVMDGFKPSQRKILFGCFKRNLKSEIRVAQLAGYVSEHAAYHHGEASLNQTITSMAQIFVGANNINLLAPVGQMGSRLLGGKDAASPRYIHTHLESIVDSIFRKEDAPILKHLEDDGDIVEPEHYLPTIPMLAINGSVGIGTGFSTDIPPHNPREIVELIKQRLAGKVETLAGTTLNPWWIGFRGAVEKKDEKQWITKALYEWNDSAYSVKITELPVGVWTKDYKAFLDTMMQGDGPEIKDEKEKPAEKKPKGKKIDDAISVSSDKKKSKPKSILKGFEDLYNDVDINFVLYLDPDYYRRAKENTTEFEKIFHLTSSWKTTNMCCFDPNMNIVRYDTIGDLIEQFFVNRLVAYENRRLYQIEKIKDEIEELNAKWLFVKSIVDGKLKIMNEEDDIVLKGLVSLGLPPRSDRENPETLGAYEYLMKLRVDRIKKKSVEEAENDLKVTNQKLKELEAMTATGIWNKELDDFSQAWERAEKTIIDFLSASNDKSEKVVSKKKVVKKSSK